MVVTATPNPSVAETNLPGCWGFSGGEVVGLGGFQQKITKTQASPGPVRFSVTAGTSTTNIDVAVIDVGCLGPEGGATWVTDDPDPTYLTGYCPGEFLSERCTGCALAERARLVNLRAFAAKEVRPLC